MFTPNTSLFASPEAAATRELLNKSDSEKPQENEESGEESESYGIDIALPDSPSVCEVREKAKDINDIIRSYTKPSDKPSTTSAGSRWRRATICASLCTNLEKEVKDKKRKNTLKPWTKPPSPIPRLHPAPPPVPSTGRPVRSGRVSVHGQPANARNDANNNNSKQDQPRTENAKELDVRPPMQPYDIQEATKDIKENQLCPDSQEPVSCNEVQKTESSTTSSDENDVGDSISELSSFCGSDSEKLTIKSWPHSTNVEVDPSIRLRQRFGRRFSLPVNCLPAQFLPTPPIMSSLPTNEIHTSQQNSDTQVNSDIMSMKQRRGSLLSNSAPLLNTCQKLSPRPSPKMVRRPSLILDLQTNRTIVSELIQERSSVISNLSKTDDAGVSKSDDGSDMENDSQRETCPRSRLLNRRASFACTSLIKEFNERVSSDERAPKSLQKKSSSLDSFLRQPRRPSPIAETTEYIEIKDVKKDNESTISDEMNIPCGKSVVSILTTSSTGSDLHGQDGSDERVCLSIQSGFPPKGWQRGRRRSMSRILEPKLLDLQRNQLGAVRVRSDAEIVKNIEDEIQQRISRRKQQLLEQGGGTRIQQRLHNKSRARSSTERLKKVLANMNGKRTTAELLQMAAAKNSE